VLVARAINRRVGAAGVVASVITTSTYGRQSINASSSGWTPAVFESV